MYVIITIIAIIVGLSFMVRTLMTEEKLVEAANRNAIFRIVAKVTLPEYGGYFMNDVEKKTLEEYVSRPSEYDKHPIGGYFKLCKSLKSTLATCANFNDYKLNFNMSEVGVGFIVFGVFVAIVALGVVY